MKTILGNKKIRKKIESNAFPIYKFLLGMVLLGQVLSMLLDYNEQMNQILHNAMFSLIGIPYLFLTWIFDKNILKLPLCICGTYLLAMNLLDHSNFQLIIAIICILIPMIIGKFFLEEGDEEEGIVE